jgi:WD40 repeat protein
MLAPARLPGRLAFSPDGALLAAGAALIDVRSGRVLRVFRGQLSPVTGAAFSPDGTLLATGSFDGTVRVWDAVDGGVQAVIAIGPDDWASDVAFSPDGTMLAAACDDSESVRLWEPRTGRALATFDIGADATSVAFSPDGRLLAVGSWSDTVDLWEVASGTVAGALEGHESAVKDVAFSPDGRLLATACLDGKTRIWDVAGGTGRTVLAITVLANPGLTGHDKGVTAVAFAPDGGLLATASEDGTVRIWDTGGWAVRLTLAHPGHELSEVAFSPDGSWIAAKSGEAVLLWDTATWAVHATVNGSGADGMALCVSADGRLLATACADRTVRIWDTATGTARTVADPGLVDAPGALPLLEFTADRTGLLTVSGDGMVRHLDIAAGGVPAAGAAGTAANERPRGPALAVSPGGELLATTTEDGPESGTVRTWDTATGTLCAVIDAADAWADPDDVYERRVPEAAFSPDGAFLATTSMLGRAFIWDAASGAPHATLTGHDRGWAVTAVAFCPDGTLLATGSMDWTARIWDARDGTLRTTLTCEETVYTVAFSPEGALLATVSADRTIWIWDLATAAARTVIRSADWVSSVAFLPGGRYLATATDTGTARIWDTGAGPETTVPAVTLVALAGDGYAALLPDGRYKLDGDTGDRLWWLDGLRRLTPGELGAPEGGAVEGGPRLLPAGARLLPDT